MVFVDALTFVLFSLAFAGAIVLYMTILLYVNYKKKKYVPITNYLDGISIPLGAIGAYLLTVGIVGQITWPLPASYNILFYEPTIAAGMVLLVLLVSIQKGIKVQYAAFFALLVGVMAIYYGIVAYNLGLTKAPLEMLVLFVSFGLANMLSFPIAIMLESSDHNSLYATKARWAILIAFWLAVFIGTVAAAGIGASALPAHLASAP